MSIASIDGILATINASRVQETILDLARAEGKKREVGVSMTDILDAFIGEVDLGVGAVQWRATLAIKGAIINALENMPGMRYIAGDA